MAGQWRMANAACFNTPIASNTPLSHRQYRYCSRVSSSIAVIVAERLSTRYATVGGMNMGVSIRYDVGGLRHRVVSHTIVTEE